MLPILKIRLSVSSAVMSIRCPRSSLFVNIMDAGWIEQAAVAAAKAQGLGTPRYIKPKRGAGYSDEE